MKSPTNNTKSKQPPPVAPSATLLIPATERMCVTLIGCGGTGSWLAPAIARLARVADRKLDITFVDPDHVEEANICRQNFCDAEIGKNKATALAERYGQAWGLDITSIEARFDANRLDRAWGSVNLLIGCVDNAAARKSINKALGWNHNLHADPETRNRFWWLDSGNAENNGQVLLGSAEKPAALEGSFPVARTCTALPSPALQHPELLKPRPEETTAAAGMTCVELMAANAQSLIVNQRIAAEAADYVARLLLRRPLKKFATYVDLDTGTSRGVPITAEAVARAARVGVELLSTNGKVRP